MNWARVAFFALYAAAVIAAAYYLQSLYLALWGLLVFVAAVLTWEAVRRLMGFLMAKYKSRTELEGNLNKMAEQMYPAILYHNGGRTYGHSRNVARVLSTVADGLMIGHHSKTNPIFPASMSFPAYMFMMARFVFHPDGREVGDPLLELCGAEFTDVADRPELRKLTTVLYFPVAGVNNVQNRFGDIHRYYDGITCGYTGLRLNVVAINFMPSHRLAFADGTFKDYHRLIQVILTTYTFKLDEMKSIVQTFERVRRVDGKYYADLRGFIYQKEQQQAVAPVAPPRKSGPRWFYPHDNDGGHLRDGFLYFGDKHLENGAPHWVPIKKLTHFLVSGMSGSGKSYFLHQILEGVAYNEKHFDDVYLIDLKGGVELWRYHGTANGLFHVIFKYDEVAAAVEGLNTLMDERLDSMRARGLRDWDGNKVLVVIDEFAELSFEMPEDKEAKAQKQKMLAGLSRLSSKARAAGIVIWAQLQKGTTDVMDSGFRNNLQSEVMFCQKTKLQAATVFGAVDSLSVDPTRLQAGEFVMLDANTRDLVYLKSRMMRGL